MARAVLVSAGEASGDLYAAMLVRELRHIWPDATFFGCAERRTIVAGSPALRRPPANFVPASDLPLNMAHFMRL